MPYREINPEGAAPFVLICDHASNAIPAEYGTLGLPREEIERHIGWDIGAGAVTERLSVLLDAPAVMGGFSRLLIDPNRAADDPTQVMKLSDGAVIPGNRRADRAEIEKRRELFWQPYQDAIIRRIDASLARGQVPAIVSIHSFTPVWRGRPRPWHVGILWDRDPRLPLALLGRLRQEPGLVVGDNEPYSGRLTGDSMYRHGTSRGLPNALIELRQDLIDTNKGADEWAGLLARCIVDAGAAAGEEFHTVRDYMTYTEEQAAE